MDKLPWDIEKNVKSHETEFTKKYISISGATLDELTSLFTTFSEETGVGLSTIYLDDWSYDGSSDWRLVGHRDCTPEEIAEFEQAQSELEAKSEAFERETYKRLKAKYGDS